MSSRRITPFALTLLLGLLLAGCLQSFPLGMSEAEWNRLTPQQQVQARQAQAEQDRLAYEAEIARQQAIQAEIDARYAMALEGGPGQRYGGRHGGGWQRGVRPGQVSQVTIRGGEVFVTVGDGFSFDRDWRDHGTTAFAIAECEAKAVDLRREDKPGTVQLHAKRLRGQLYLSTSPMESGCDTGTGSLGLVGPYPPQGRSTLTIRDEVRNAVIRIEPWVG